MPSNKLKWFTFKEPYFKWKQGENPWVFKESRFKKLMKQAENNLTRKELKQIIKGPRFKFYYHQTKALRMGGLNIWLNPLCPYNSLGIYYGMFCMGEHSMVKGFSLLTDKIVIDIGANDGFYTLFIKKNFPNVKVIAVEPNPVCLKILKRNLEANNIKDVTIVDCAITDKKGKINFEIIPADTAIGGVKIERKPWMKKGVIKDISVKSMTLPDLFRKYRIHQVSLVKIDTEGSEVKIIKGALSVLSLVDKVVVEYHSKTLHKEVKELLRKTHKLIKDETRDYGDAYFVKRD